MGRIYPALDGIAMTESELARLVAESDCTRLIHCYGRAIDWRDGEGLRRLFWPDAVIDLGFFKGNAEEAVGFLLENAARSERRFHSTTNIVLHINGDSAFADSCCTTHAVGDDGSGALVWQLFFGRYLDRLERRGNEWRFVERTFVLNGFHHGAIDEPSFLDGVGRAAHLDSSHPLFRFR
jgi:hypothetical protein